MEYFIDQEKYLYLILLHSFAIIYIGIVAVLATGRMFLMYLQYICGIFNICSYRIEHAININIQQNITQKTKILMSEGIICAVDSHRQAMKLIDQIVCCLMSIVEVMMLCLIVFNVICLNTFQVSFLFRNI
ncbi:PREDICTED: uncharacterized protein LOC108692148 [Atta colombica]|uniref:uncharacterized protein LOC108692148 n=1 Tax=Atta colombica TaxID=520822 RepID=UPI00084CD614|nr:PREDICTED: uncharacterized protein LOC108692148 [Atta colombica]